MLRKNSSERIVCARCRERDAVSGFDTVPVCKQCQSSEKDNLTSIASTGDIHGRPRPVRRQGPTVSRNS